MDVRRAAIPQGRRRTTRGERGQVLLLFVAIFSVILMMGAFAVDQGLWLAKRRVSQKDADVAARGGAIALLIGAAAPQGDPAASNTAGCDASTAVAEANLVTTDNLDCVQASHCLASSDGMPSVALTIHRPTLGLFSRLPLIGGGPGSVIDSAASATACIGTTTRLAIGADAPQAAPLVLYQSDPDPNSCFFNTRLVYGKECVVFGTADFNGGKKGGSVPSANAAITADARRGCFNGATSDVFNAIKDGTTFDCTIGSGRVRTTDLSRSGSGGARTDVFSGVRNRLQTNAACATGYNDAFHAAYGYGDAYSAFANGPAVFKKQDTSRPSDPGDTVYVQNGCSPASDPPLGDKRIIVLPIIRTHPGGNDTVRGFAVVYVTGCFSSGDQFNTPATLNTCDTFSSGPSGNAGYQVRGVPLRVLMVHESLGRIKTTSANAPLTIQTVK